MTLHLVQQPYDVKDHGDRLRFLAEQLTGETSAIDPAAMAQAARQLQDYAALLEHAERYGWWDR